MRYEMDLECGDTVSSNVWCRTGVYRKCIHCDKMQRVTAVRDTAPESGAALAMMQRSTYLDGLTWLQNDALYVLIRKCATQAERASQVLMDRQARHYADVIALHQEFVLMLKDINEAVTIEV